MPIGPIHPVTVPPAPPTTPIDPLPIGSLVSYILSTQDLEMIAGQQDDGVLPDGLSVGQICPATVASTTGDGLATLKVQLTDDGTATYWALSRAEGTEPGTWARIETV